MIIYNASATTAGTNVLLTLFGIAIIVIFVGFWIWALVDIVRRPTKNQVLWFILVFLTGALGALIYYLIGRDSSKK